MEILFQKDIDAVIGFYKKNNALVSICFTLNRAVINKVGTGYQIIMLWSPFQQRQAAKTINMGARQPTTAFSFFVLAISALAFTSLVHWLKIWEVLFGEGIFLSQVDFIAQKNG